MKNADNSSAAENTIFNLLAADETNYEFPSLQTKAVNAISTKLTDVIYDTLKQKSIASVTKRCNILKFLNATCKVCNHQLDSDYLQIYLDTYKEANYKDIEIQHLIHTCNDELFHQEFRNDLNSFHKFTNAKKKAKAHKLELIKRQDQTNLSLYLDMSVFKGFQFCETNPSLIYDVLGEKHCEKPKTIEYERDFRMKQIKFCYGLKNLNFLEHEEILKHVLKRLLTYDILERYEIQLLLDIVETESKRTDDPQSRLIDFVAENFYFIFEKHIIVSCTRIIKLNNDMDIIEYLDKLENNVFGRMHTICMKNTEFRYKIKTLINELYVYSYCNNKILQLLNLID